MARASGVPPLRLRALNDRPVRPDGAYVVYWMVAYRRLQWNFALQHAVGMAGALRRPLLILEALRCDYPWASDRLHAFVLHGMAEHAKALKGASRPGVAYYPYVEPQPGAGRGLLARLAQEACAVVTDDFPAFAFPRWLAAAASRLRVALVAVDSNGLLPMRAAPQAYPSAYAFRRTLQRALPEHLTAFPRRDPLARAGLPGNVRLPAPVRTRWPAASPRLLAAGPATLRRLPIDHSVGVVSSTLGGTTAGRRALAQFVERGLPRYAAERNEPDRHATSGLSPYLHFGHLAAHEVFTAVAAKEQWTHDRLSGRADGKRAGWWGMSASAEEFLDQLVTWRELGFNLCAHRGDVDRWDSLPAWARQTLDKHARDPRPFVYTLEELSAGLTHDRLWNAAQAELRSDGRIHNYLRMLWGKKILEWSPSPQEALQAMIELNDRFALDGRDPNSYSGICWCLGRYDRPWAPERPIFGTVRFMSSASAARKLHLEGYLRRFAPARR